QEPGGRRDPRRGAPARRRARPGVRLHTRDPAHRRAWPRRHIARRRRRRAGRTGVVALGATRRGPAEGRSARAQARRPRPARLRCRHRGDGSRRGPRRHPARRRAMPDPLRRRLPPARGPRLSRPLDRPAASLLGAVAMVVCGVLPLRDAYAAIDLDVLVFLLGLMLIVGYLEVGKFFEWAAEWILRRARTPVRLLLGVVVGGGLLSA